MHFIGITILCLLIAQVKSIANVLCIDGFGDLPFGLMTDRCKEIAKKYPGTKIYQINTGSLYKGVRSVRVQIAQYMDKVKQIARENPNGINLIGYSLGGSLGRAYIELLPGLKVRTFVSVNSPIMGTYDKAPTPNLWSFIEKFLFWKIVHPFLRISCLMHTGSNYTVVNDFYHDPTSSTPFAADYLQWINNYNGSCSSCKANFLEVKKVVLVVSSSDGVITPWFSGLGAFYDKNLNMAPLENQPIYHTLGLKTLIDQGRLLRLIIPNAGHLNVIFCKHLFEKYVTNYLQ